MTLQELKDLYETGTPGLWITFCDFRSKVTGEESWAVAHQRQVTTQIVGNNMEEGDAQLISVSHNWLPKLIAVAEAADLFIEQYFLHKSWTFGREYTPAQLSSLSSAVLFPN